MKYGLKTQSSDLGDYLHCTKIVDYDNENVANLSNRFWSKSESVVDFVRAVYKYVRDEIRHSADWNGHFVTCRASDVLKYGEGICFAKSHLFAALMRCNGVPTGFCYQVLRLDDDDSPLILHGFNAVYLEGYDRWIRLDARGNKPGIAAQFSLDNEQLAYSARADQGERDVPTIFTEPDLNVIDSLMQAKSFEELWNKLPKTLAMEK